MGKSLEELFGPRPGAAGASRGRAAAKAHAGVKPSLGPAKRQKQPLAQMNKRMRPPAPPRKRRSKKQPLGLLGETEAEHAKSHCNKAERNACPRCQFAAGAFKCWPWLEVCPAADGAWRLGCRSCAAARKKGHASGRQGKLARHRWLPKATSVKALKVRLQVHCTGMLHKQAAQLAIVADPEASQALPTGSKLPTRSKSGAADRKGAGAAATIDKKAKFVKKTAPEP